MESSPLNKGVEPAAYHVASTVHDLLPALGDEAASPLRRMEWLCVRDRIGTPGAIDAALAPLPLPSDTALPVIWATMLIRTVTLYALAVDLFDTPTQALLQWWQRPIALEAGGAALALRDWVAIPGVEADVASRIWRTQHGVY